MNSFENIPSTSESEEFEQRESERKLKPLEEVRSEGGFLSRLGGKAGKIGRVLLMGTALVLASETAAEARHARSPVGGRTQDSYYREENPVRSQGDGGSWAEVGLNILLEAADEALNNGEGIDNDGRDAVRGNIFNDDRGIGR